MNQSLIKQLIQMKANGAFKTYIESIRLRFILRSLWRKNYAQSGNWNWHVCCGRRRDASCWG